MPTNTPISAIILAKNEESHISDCISSIRPYVSEVIVCDDQSTDSTVELAKNSGTSIIPAVSGAGFAKMRNEAMTHAKNDWILFIDADERVDADMGNWLSKFSQVVNTTGYKFSREDYFWGVKVRRGEVAKAFDQGILRLINRKFATFHGDVHEVAVFDPTQSVEKGEGRLLHYAHNSISDFIKNVNDYSSQRAQELAGSESNGTTLFKMILFPPSKFLYTYIFRLGFLDGTPGFAYSFVMSFHSFLVRAKMLASH